MDMLLGHAEGNRISAEIWSDIEPHNAPQAADQIFNRRRAAELCWAVATARDVSNPAVSG
jgi:hypothetical protein